MIPQHHQQPAAGLAPVARESSGGRLGGGSRHWHWQWVWAAAGSKRLRRPRLPMQLWTGNSCTPAATTRPAVAVACSTPRCAAGRRLRRQQWRPPLALIPWCWRLGECRRKLRQVQKNWHVGRLLARRQVHADGTNNDVVSEVALRPCLTLGMTPHCVRLCAACAEAHVSLCHVFVLYCGHHSPACLPACYRFPLAGCCLLTTAAVAQEFDSSCVKCELRTVQMIR